MASAWFAKPIRQPYAEHRERRWGCVTRCAIGWAARGPFLAATLIFLAGHPALANSPPVVSNVIASQREGTRLVDISYTLIDADDDPCTVWILASNNGGITWDLPTRSAEDDIGNHVTPGRSKHIVWNAGKDVPGHLGSVRVRVVANDSVIEEMEFIPAGEFLMG